MKRTLFTAFAVLMTACTPLAVGSGVPALAQGLVPFDACEDYLTHVKTEAKRIVTPWGLEGGGWYGPDIWMMEDRVMLSAEGDGGGDGGAPSNGGQAGVDYSTTNVQEAGVDEPDIIKTNGNYIYAISNGTLFVVDVTGEPTITDRLRLENGWGEILLAGDRIVVLSTQYGGGVHPLPVEPGIAAPGGDYYYSSPVSVLTEIDVSDPADIRLIRTLYLDGSYISARMNGDVARIVITARPTGFQWQYPEGGGLLAEIRAKNANRAIIDASTLENWIPYYVLEEADGSTSDGLLIDCHDAYHPQEFAGLGMLTIVTVDLSDGLAPDAVGVLAEGDTVYASTDSLYVASRQWVDWNELSEAELEERASGEYTEIHKFDISDPATTEYRATGSVDGYLLNQFSLSEHDGYLRVATTDQAPWWGWNDRPSESFVHVLAEREGRLDIVGSVGGLGKGEQIYSVRFMGDMGYVVTFRQTDPLYTIDLSDPANPTMVGELKILGYSAYLHPLGDGLLLGVGQDATEEGWTKGTQVSVFDVSDPANPERIHQYTMTDGYSEAEYDHRAFLYWAPTSTAVIPVQRWGWDERSGKDDHFVGAIGLELDRDRGIQEIGSVVHDGSEPWYGQIRRSLVVGDTVFTMSELGLAGSDLRTFESSSWVSF
ncbi:MAG: benzoate transporter [Acidimicrobiia bacterium]|nr:beta-propeller domain-containing protein [Acidimicrobiia bacterium]NNF09835.1 benzoate transporter [Acidimicrobiia bacterium]NNL71088.1 benzoate transporter [Acidimicrobiia bacterium]